MKVKEQSILEKVREANKRDDERIANGFYDTYSEQAHDEYILRLEIG